MSGSTVRAIRFDSYGDVDVLEVAEVPRPHAGPGRVVVDVVVAAFRGAVAVVFRGPVEEISPEEVRVALLARGIFPAAAEVVVWLIPGIPLRATEVPLASG